MNELQEILTIDRVEAGLTVANRKALFQQLAIAAGRKTGLRGLSSVTVDDWQRIGTLRFTEAVCSYNGDHVIQFHHPRWRDDRNDRSTYVRVDQERVRR